MDHLYHAKLMRCIKRISEIIESGNSLTVAKRYASDEMNLSDYDIQIMHGMVEYKDVKENFRHRNRENRKYVKILS